MEDLIDRDDSLAKEDRSILIVDQLTKSYDNKKAVNSLSFNIKPGEIYGLLGPNGAGKTTTIKSIMGMIEFDKGKISLNGLNPVEQAKEVKKQIGYVAEEPLLYDSMTPAELFNFVASIRNLDPEITRKKVENLLDSFDATKHYRDLIATLSKGNRQKIQIITALIHDPKLLILDEPLSGLDAKSRRIVRNILELHTSSGNSVLLCTHAMEDAQGLCDRIGIINLGSLIAEGTFEELSEISKAPLNSLEEIFLQLTEQDKSVAAATAKLEGNYNNNNFQNEITEEEKE